MTSCDLITGETEKDAAEISTKEEIIRSTSEVDKHHLCRWMGVIGLSPFIHFTFIALSTARVRPDSA